MSILGLIEYLFCSIFTAPDCIKMRLSARVAAEFADAMADRGFEWARTLCVYVHVYACVCVCECVCVSVCVCMYIYVYIYI